MKKKYYKICSGIHAAKHASYEAAIAADHCLSYRANDPLDAVCQYAREGPNWDVAVRENPADEDLERLWDETHVVVAEGDSAESKPLAARCRYVGRFEVVRGGDGEIEHRVEVAIIENGVPSKKWDARIVDVANHMFG